ncbi:hypothetical protein SAMN02745217_03385 [Anaerocolumna xylanovorans DSM 12503]|uniref:Uncharacterized protein n=1 Tax=Anaerocolumna xylanovorans DSM 12503 TaxID=1121345 RepID=A0A1M7YGX7_9FIRM|nr:hypothetical protein SAMN02745217_03385 [Anaerocolumna xylanovorans DSM 12503]
MNYVFETERLCFRKFKSADAEMLFSYLCEVTTILCTETKF